jgi:hypothetical protein
MNINDIFDPFQDFYEQNLINSIIEQTINQPSLNKKILSEKGEKQLKKMIYNSRDFSMKECPITMREFKENDLVTQLPCNHIFDSSGILMWLKEEKASCPVCRMELDFIEVKQESNTVLDSSGLFQTNPLELFSNITIDLSLNPNLLEPYNRNYNIESFQPLSFDNDEDDDFDFYNSLQFFQNTDDILSEFRSIIQQIDLSGNIIE